MRRNSCDALADRIAEQAAHLDAATHKLLTDLRTFDEQGGWAQHGARSCGQWLSWRVGWDLRTANEHVRVAKRLGTLPRIDEALQRGEISFSKVRAMARIATPQNEEMLLEEARHSTGAQLEKICRQYAAVRRHEQDASPADDMPKRFVRRRETADGMVEIAAVLHPEEAAIVWASIERVAVGSCRTASNEETGSAEPTNPNDCGGLGANDSTKGKVPTAFDRASALVEIAQQVLRGTSPRRAPIDLMLCVSIEALQSTSAGAQTIGVRPTSIDDEPFDPTHLGVLGDGTCLPAIAARRLACDCGLTTVLEDASGSPLSVGRKRRTIPAAMKKAMLCRDKTCRFPGCSARVFLEGHHVRHWADGGETSLGNVVSVCSFHHRFVHEYGYRVELTCNGEARFIDPRGQVIRDVMERIVHADLGWPAILAANAELAISHETCACGWDGTPVDYHACIDALIAADEGRIRGPV